MEMNSTSSSWGGGAGAKLIWGAVGERNLRTTRQPASLASDDAVSDHTVALTHTERKDDDHDIAAG
ncbi:MAG: hypothetical protein QOH54_3597 [Mycobacterium sp.]|jgi:hypothetical protein|nr:hypothetical protein [Mycobacterium sp.]MDT5292139.1 hypothetical protein [Mycobacterium sp.]